MSTAPTLTLMFFSPVPRRLVGDLALRRQLNPHPHSLTPDSRKRRETGELPGYFESRASAWDKIRIKHSKEIKTSTSASKDTGGKVFVRVCVYVCVVEHMSVPCM